MDISKIKAIIFDIDGTLYDLKKMHTTMAIRLVSYYLLHISKIKELVVIYRFRNFKSSLLNKEIENLDNSRYKAVAKSLGLSADRVKEIINFWVYEEPLKYLAKCQYPAAISLIKSLSEKYAVAFLSDYPAVEKIKVMGFPVNHTYYTGDKAINAFKPDSRGLEVVMSDLKIKPSEGLMVGDMIDRDGLMAERAGMPFFLVENNRSFMELKKMFFP